MKVLKFHLLLIGAPGNQFECRQPIYVFALLRKSERERENYYYCFFLAVGKLYFQS